MNEAKARRYAAILEIIILLSIANYYINKIILNNHIYEVSSNFNQSRQNPSTIFTAGLYGKSSKEVISGIMGQKTQGIFKQFLSFLTPIFSVYAIIFEKFKKSINGIRMMLRPIRDFFDATARRFYSIIQKFTIGITYSMHKMRNSMRRSMSGFNMMMHSLEHTRNSMQALVTSSPVKFAVKWGDRAQWVWEKGNKLGLFCFDKDTYIKLKSGEFIKIFSINVGDILEDGSEVIATQVFENKYSVYKYENIYVSGEHLVKENDNWVRVRDSKKGTPVYVKPPFLYCLSTSTGNIKIGNYLFKDYEGASGKFINKTINSVILNNLNENKDVDIDEIAYGPDYLENGFHEDTLVEMKGTSHKKIKDIKIGDMLSYYNKVLGKVTIGSRYVKFYKDHNDVLLTSNSKVFHHGVWKNIETLPDIEPEKDLVIGNAVNIVTDSNTLKVKSKSKTSYYRDYVEVCDKNVENEIENIVTRAANY